MRDQRPYRHVIDSFAWKTEVRPHVAFRASYRCEICHRFTGLHGACDHVVPRSLCDSRNINPWSADNLQWLCQKCHNSKSAGERQLAPAKPRKRPRSNTPGREAYHAALKEEFAIDCNSELEAPAHA